MATVTLARLRELLARATGFFEEGTASGGSTSQVADSNPGSIDQYSARQLIGKWVHITGGSSGSAPDFQARRIQSISTITITVDTAFSAAVASSDTYEILSHHPNSYRDALQEAIRTTYPDLYLPIIDQSLRIDNLLSNWHMETFTSSNVPDNWTEVGSPTTTEENTRVFQGTSSIKSVSGAINQGYLQNLFTSVEVRDAAGRSIRCWAHGWADGAVGMKVRLSFDEGSTFTDSVTHSGSSEWERLEVITTIPETATSVTAYLWNSTSGTPTVYWDDSHAAVGTLTRYTMPTTFTTWPSQVLQQRYLSEPDGLYVAVNGDNPAAPGHILRLYGQGRFTVPTTDSATIELDESRAELIIAKAAVALFRKLATEDIVNRDMHIEDARTWSNRVNELVRQPGIRMRAIPAIKSHGAVRFTDDGTNKYLELVR